MDLYIHINLRQRYGTRHSHNHQLTQSSPCKVSRRPDRLSSQPDVCSVHISELTGLVSQCIHFVQIFDGEAYDGFETMNYWGTEMAVHAYDRFFGRAGLGAMPDTISFPCCPQFAVTNDTVRLRSRYFWERNLHFLKHNDIVHSNDHPKHYMVGDLWTAVWPMLFGKSSNYKLEIPDQELFSGRITEESIHEGSQHHSEPVR